MSEVPFDALPGGRLVQEGLADLAQGRETVAALAVECAAGRLRRAGVDVPAVPARDTATELRLYALLGALDRRRAYVRYNAVLRELDSFAAAAEARARRR